MQPVPPEQGTAKQIATERGSRAVTWLVLLTVACALSLASRPVERFALLTALLWLAVRAPIGPALALQPLFSPATFYRPLLGPLSSSAGVLALAGTLLTIAGVWLWHRRLPRRWPGIVVGIALLIASPYLISSLGRGITPPADGVSVGLWLIWQLAILVSASALLVPCAALFRGDGPEPRSSWRTVAGVAIAFAAAIVGVMVWSPRGGWPDWYTWLWTPALLLVTLPAPRWAAISGIALVAGSSSALVTWGAELSGKIQVAARDVARLGGEPDPLAVPLLERFAEQVRRAPAATTASEMYALWHGSALGNQGYPAHLALWDNRGALLDELALDSLDLPAVAALDRGAEHGADRHAADRAAVPDSRRALRDDGAGQPRRGDDRLGRPALASGAAWTGRTPARSRRACNRRSTGSRSLLPRTPRSGCPAHAGGARAGRPATSIPSPCPGGTRIVHATVDLRGPVPLFVRGVLVVLLDAAVLAALWFLAELVSGARFSRPRWRSLARSFRIRLAATLAAFFLLPAVGFAAWSFARLGEEVQRSRDLLITQTLRDAVLTAGGSLRGGGPAMEERLRELSRRIDADLALYQGGRLTGTSTQVLEDLGVLGQLMDPKAFAALALAGELEITRDGHIPRLAERVGYRVIQPGSPANLGVLATPQLADEGSLAVRQLDLALVLLLATLAGVAGALLGAGRASRTLSRPVAELRRSALALGKGEPMPAHSSTRRWSSSRCSVPSNGWRPTSARARAHWRRPAGARRRCSARSPPAWSPSNPGGRVIMANRQALDLLGTRLRGGRPVSRAACRRSGRPRAPSSRSFSRTGAPSRPRSSRSAGDGSPCSSRPSGRMCRGVVIALNDVTDVSRAERVLAWGEMARQIAHEIKNPLTPMRLGIQHLRRVYRDRRGDFDSTLDETSRADPERDRPARHHRACVQPVRRAGGRLATGGSNRSRRRRRRGGSAVSVGGGRLRGAAGGGARQPAARPGPTRSRRSWSTCWRTHGMRVPRGCWCRSARAGFE